jgi:hypothetical protein
MAPVEAHNVRVSYYHRAIVICWGLTVRAGVNLAAERSSF